MPITAKMFPGLIEAASKEGTSAFEQGSESALKKYLQAKEPETAGKKQSAQNESNLKTLQDPRVQDLLNQGGSAKVGDISLGADPYAHMMGKQQSGDAAARLKANQIYNQGLGKIQGVAQAASEGMDAINDPQNIGSLGQARTLMLKSMGMNRYNEQEAKAVLPPSLHGYVASLFNQGGTDIQPLNDVQRANVNRFFKGQLDNASAQHQMLKQNAMAAYSTSPYANAGGFEAMKQMGAPAETMFSQAQSKYKEIPQTQGPNLTSQPQPSIVDKLKSYLGGGAPRAPTPPPAPQTKNIGGTAYTKNPQTGLWETQ